MLDSLLEDFTSSPCQFISIHESSRMNYTCSYGDGPRRRIKHKEPSEELLDDGPDRLDVVVLLPTLADSIRSIISLVTIGSGSKWRLDLDAGLCNFRRDTEA